VIIAGCGKKSSKTFPTLTQQEIDTILENLKSIPAAPVDENEKAYIKTSLGTIEFEFFTEVAPNHCANFKKLANSGFFNGTTFHRVDPNFMIQGGDILTRDSNISNDGTGGPGYNIDAEFSTIHHDRGIVSTARSEDVNSAGSQFFICVMPKYHLDGEYTVFGKVTKGMEIVDKIANGKTYGQLSKLEAKKTGITNIDQLIKFRPNLPLEPVVMEDVTVK
jgi:cyclophilin family peptidyl-prolyl cis-trans isomerase